MALSAITKSRSLLVSPAFARFESMAFVRFIPVRGYVRVGGFIRFLDSVEYSDRKRWVDLGLGFVFDERAFDVVIGSAAGA